MANITPDKTEPPPSMNGKDPHTANPDPFDPQSLRHQRDDRRQRRDGSDRGAGPETEAHRVHPRASRADYMVPSMLLMERDTGIDTESYPRDARGPTPGIAGAAADRLYTAITKRGTVFLWPIKLPGDDNDRFRRISDTALQAAEQAKTLWVKVRVGSRPRRVRDAARQGRSRGAAVAGQVVPRPARDRRSGTT